MDIVISYSGGDKPLTGQGFIMTKELEPISRRGRTGGLLRKRQDATLVVNEDFSIGWEDNWATSDDSVLDDVVSFTEIESGLQVDCDGSGTSNFFYLFLKENDFLDTLFRTQSSSNVITRLTGKFLTTQENRYIDLVVARPSQMEPYTFKIEGDPRRIYTSRGIEKTIAESLNGVLTGVMYDVYRGSTIALRFRMNVPISFEVHFIRVNTL